MTRCLRMSNATSLTSCGVTYPRPTRKALARAARQRLIEARGEAPYSMSGFRSLRRYCSGCRVVQNCIDDLALIALAGVSDDHLQHEAIDLGFGQRVGSLLLDGVLRGQHEK